MNNTQPKESVLRLQNMYFDEFSFHRAEQLDPQSIELSVNFERQVENNENANKVSLKCNIEDTKKEAMQLTARIVGEFTVDTDSDDVKKHLLEKNALTVLFPYLRSMVALLTSQAGVPQIMLPIMNIAEMFRE